MVSFIHDLGDQIFFIFRCASPETKDYYYFADQLTYLKQFFLLPIQQKVMLPSSCRKISCQKLKQHKPRYNIYTPKRFLFLQWLHNYVHLYSKTKINSNYLSFIIICSEILKCAKFQTEKWRESSFSSTKQTLTQADFHQCSKN